MTAPLDIGLEFHDQALGHGQEDILDLEMSKKLLGNDAHVDLASLVDNRDSFESDEEEQGEGVVAEGNLDPDDEEEKIADELEVELDGMYDAYQERLKERDAKYRVKEARRKDKSREEWHGIQRQDSDDDDDDCDGSEGGYDVVQAAKAQFGEDSDSDSDDNLDPLSANKKLKRPGTTHAEVDERRLKRARTEQLETSQAARMWFGQEVFAGVDFTASNDEDEDENEMDDVEDEDMSDEDASRYEGSAGSEDDPEVTSREDLDDQMWDDNHEDQDEIKRSTIQSTVIRAHSRQGC